MGSAKILITEDNLDLQIELADFLEFNGYCTDTADTLASMNEKLTADQFDFLILDFGLPDGDGLAEISTIRHRFGPAMSIVALTARGQPNERALGLEAGADYYLVKPAYLPELKAVLNQLQTFRGVIASGINTVGKWQLHTRTQQLVTPDQQVVRLTGTEVMLLKALACQRDTLINRLQLSAEIFNVSTADTRRLDTLMSRLRNKVQTATGLQLPITTYRNRGYQVSDLTQVN